MRHVRWRVLISTALGFFVAAFLALSVPADHPYRYIALVVALFLGGGSFCIAMVFLDLVRSVWRHR
jgi:hypothetical protein